MKKLLSVVVLSYNRPEQIRRILEKISCTTCTDFNLIVKDDCSPRQSEIKDVVQEFKNIALCEILFHSNDENMGYDKNLYDAFFITNSEYVFLLSDDDFIEGDKIEGLIKILRSDNRSVYFTPYYSNGALNRFGSNLFDLNRISSVIYNSILFSGLVFKRNRVLKLDLDTNFLANCIYTQVYLSTVIIYQDKDFGFGPNGLLYLGGDGENYFGKNKAATNKEILRDRESITANLKYQTFLIKVVEKIAIDTERGVYINFIKEYNKRLVSYGLRAIIAGKADFKSFVDCLTSTGYSVPLYVRFSFVLIRFIPTKCLKALRKQLIRLLRNSG